MASQLSDNQRLSPQWYLERMVKWCEGLTANTADLRLFRQEVTGIYGAITLMREDRFISLVYEVPDDTIHCCCIRRRRGVDGSLEHWTDSLYLDRPKDAVYVMLDVMKPVFKGRRCVSCFRASSDPEGSIVLSQKLIEMAMVVELSVQ